MVDAGEVGRQGPSGAERHERAPVAGGDRGPGQLDGLALGPAAAQVVLEDQDFHCPGPQPRLSPAFRHAVDPMNSGASKLLVRWLVLALGVAFAATFVPGIGCDGASALIVVALLLSLFNAVLKPLLVLFTLPFILVTMGLGMVVINAFLFLLAGRLVHGFHVDGFWSALLGSLVVSATNIAAGVFRGGRPPRPPRAGRSRQAGESGDVIDI
jgi:putative membrane protein